LSFVSVSSLLLYYVFPLRILTLNIYYNVVEQLLTWKSAWSLSFVKTKIKWKVIRTKKKSLWNEETKLVYGMKERNLSKNYLLLLMTTFITTTNTWSHLLKTIGKKSHLLKTCGKKTNIDGKIRSHSVDVQTCRICTAWKFIQKKPNFTRISGYSLLLLLLSAIATLFTMLQVFFQIDQFVTVFLCYPSWICDNEYENYESTPPAKTNLYNFY